MKLQTLKPAQSLNQAYRKEHVEAKEFERFADALEKLLEEMEKQRENNTQFLMADFLKDAYYKNLHAINPSADSDIDTVIHHQDTQKSPVGVMIENKKPNSNEFITKDDFNKKSFHQLIYYYLIERIEEKNIEIKNLVITDVYEWFIFDENQFNKLFHQNKSLVKKFNTFIKEKGKGKGTSYFYKEIAKPFIDSLDEEIICTHFDLRDYQKELESFRQNFGKEEQSEQAQKDQKKLIHLYKILSPVHLLKKPFSNDSNSLNKDFYNELLHILGLEEVKEQNKKVIKRKNVNNRERGSFLENTLAKVERKRVETVRNHKSYGDSDTEKYENIALELCITWTNRILFLKLLEAQLLQYHKTEKKEVRQKYKFLNIQTIQDFNMLDELFFDVLAKRPKTRREHLNNFAHIPYLNSSLFEETPLEADTVLVNNLADNAELTLHSKTVLKDDNGKRREGKETPLSYFFQFLDAYNFSSEGTEEIRKDKKTLINASVLGLIFEKINGYKDGSFYTPSFITMYMCRQTLRRSVIQKFSEEYKMEFENFEDLSFFLSSKYKPEDNLKNNKIFDSIKICDPAVGSGHFLVSALNELIVIKSELGILADSTGKSLRVDMRIENDELFAFETENDFFEYQIGNKISQTIQKTLFHEKQKLIENCLFGVDINPNSVKICRLRLWIELLKNAYYTEESNFEELETLPNIDINIKTGNSLISRFDLDADISKALKKSNWTIDSYRMAVHTYRNATSKDQKFEMEKLIDTIKADFRSEVSKKDPKILALSKKAAELQTLLTQTSVFELSKTEQKAKDKNIEKLKKEVLKLNTEIEDIKSSKIYQNAFEWRFEFPEVLDNKGNFIGFDVVIGNPPYIRQEEILSQKPHLQDNYKTYNGKADLLVFFIELGMNIMRDKGNFTFIIANKFMRAGFGEPLRIWLQQFQLNEIIDFGDLPVFEEATTYPCIISVHKEKPNNFFKAANVEDLDFDLLETRLKETAFESDQKKLEDTGWNLANEKTQSLLLKIKNQGQSLGVHLNGKMYYGIKTGLNEAFIIDEETKNTLIKKHKKSLEIIKPFLSGRDIKKYQFPLVREYLIFAYKGIDIKKYPAIFNHLEKHEVKLKRKAGGNKWYELQSSPANTNRYEQEKIVWAETSLNNQFCIIDKGVFLNKTTFLIPSNDLVLLGIMNSNLVRFYLDSVVSKVRGGYFSMSKAYVETTPIVYPEDKTQIKEKVTQILSLKKSNPSADTSALESEIDALVYVLYGLSEEEVAIIKEQ
ncbi:Eco57I restriction endonuclease [Bernardetia litoralis DSM 6794]|uniref:site-specific DNA-methyltransferase (adenine-specific) n=1 Tax=Bernardetia litoralis (strain ATCC 23117 / DSM 6794 / NBRC 15988 / NCIMB 1366 / Fx l1 / Sio-4) TaxID=880071 RepID=I4APK2_BERLS|nr:TaqI-like C-terminal specificity domain-containing protein [Bernardetia litoralis]AFM05887.1 Eco57I restriction endonuclease [Bernardetia litoralis DSM 6794]